MLKKISNRLGVLFKVAHFFLFPPSRGFLALRKIWHARRGAQFTDGWKPTKEGSNPPQVTPQDNPLLTYFESKKEGRGIWKWAHYFEVYEQFFSPFVGKQVHLLEIGVYSGGSLEMWPAYFGEKARIYGVDIEPACQQYANGQVAIFIGDQADRSFWQHFKTKVPHLDLIIDDGGHTTQQQIVTLEEMLPHLSPGGVYIIEDIHGSDNLFASYLYGLQESLHAADFLPGSDYKTKANPFQQMIRAIHIYPYLAVIQKRKHPILEFPSPKRGTQWQPFYE